jgi:DivIVA domain-containing protein
MPLTPADIHNVSFRKPPIGRRGYDQEDVDSFLDEVERELLRLLDENGTLHDRVRRAGADAFTATAEGRGGTEDAALVDAVARLQHARELRSGAEREANSLRSQLAQAIETASAVPEEDGRADRVLTMARRTADQHVRDAHREADEVVSSARSEAGDITGDARLRADVVEGDARRSHAAAMNDLAAAREAALGEIDRLGRLAKGYQEALASHFDHQLKTLGGDQGTPGDAPG